MCSLGLRYHKTSFPRYSYMLGIAGLRLASCTNISFPLRSHSIRVTDQSKGSMDTVASMPDWLLLYSYSSWDRSTQFRSNMLQIFRFLSKRLQFSILFTFFVKMCVVVSFISLSLSNISRRYNLLFVLTHQSERKMWDLALWLWQYK